MSATQIQLKISLSEQLSGAFGFKAARVGVPVTQLVKHLIIKEVEDLEYQHFKCPRLLKKEHREAMEHIDEAVDALDFFNQLNES